jgi:hypothetical protein
VPIYLSLTAHSSANSVLESTSSLAIRVLRAAQTTNALELDRPDDFGTVP